MKNIRTCAKGWFRCPNTSTTSNQQGNEFTCRIGAVGSSETRHAAAGDFGSEEPANRLEVSTSRKRGVECIMARTRESMEFDQR